VELAGLREEVAFISVEFRMSERTACKLLGVERSSYRYESRPERNIELREALVKLSRQKPRYGHRRLYVFPHSHSLDGCCELNLQLNSNPSALTCPD
jgi:putative transposase